MTMKGDLTMWVGCSKLDGRGEGWYHGGMTLDRRIRLEEPVLTGERVQLRIPTTRESSAIADYLRRNREFHRATDPIRPDECYTSMYWKRAVRVIKREFQLDASVRMMLYSREDLKQVIGTVNFNQIVRGVFQASYLGYALDEQEEGKGLMSEALRIGIDYMFRERNLHRIMANYLPENTRSARVLEKLGFVIEGRAKAYLHINGRWQDHILTSLTNADWRQPTI
jgi:ribosomal-protein-alanine N-acetyltransferase